MYASDSFKTPTRETKAGDSYERESVSNKNFILFLGTFKDSPEDKGRVLLSKSGYKLSDHFGLTQASKIIHVYPSRHLLSRIAFLMTADNNPSSSLRPSMLLFEGFPYKSAIDVESGKIR